MRRALGMLREDLRQKARSCYGGDDRRALLRAAVADGTLAMVLYRLMQGSREAGSPALEAVFNKLGSIVGNCVIGRGAEFGPGFVIFHSSGVVINGKVKGGARVELHHEVTIGDDEEGRSAVLGSDIRVGAGAKIIGPVTIGDGARIGANAVVVHDVAPHTTVVGVPAREVRDRRQTA